MPTKPLHCSLAALCVALTLTLAWPARAQPAPPPPSPEKIFDPIASVLQNPRCLNCHMIDRPFQLDAQVPHAQMIVRGADDKGAPTMRCAACHQEHNSADGRVPGAKGWHLAPRPMAWQGLSRAQICRNLKDPATNGNRVGMEQVIEHMKVDPLVLWAWNPGAGRSTPSIGHAEFVKSLEAWAAAGGPCPGDAQPEASRPISASPRPTPATAASMNTHLLTHPVVKSALEAWQGKDLPGWLAHFAPGAELFDDGAPRDLKAFSEAIGKERFIEYESVSDGGLRVVGPFHSDQWGEFKTYFKFRLNADQKIDRLEIGQAG